MYKFSYKFSVVIIGYNSLKTLKLLLISVNEMLYDKDSIEIIYIDDGSTDSTPQLIEKYLKDKRINLKKLEQNTGQGYCRNLALKYSSSEYVAFIDADDIWKANKLKYQINLMKKNKHDFTFTGYEIINKKGKVIGKRSAPNKISFNKLLTDCKIGLSTVVLKKKLINRNYKFPNIKTKEDFVLWLKLSKKIDLIGINSYLTKWRKLDDSLSSSTLQKIIDGYKVYNKFLKLNKISSFFYLLLLSISYFKKNIN